MVDGGVGDGPKDKLLGVGDGGPKLRLWGPGDGMPKLILESESSLRAGLCDVSLHLRGLPDILLLPLPDWWRECANWAAANCWCCNLKQGWKKQLYVSRRQQNRSIKLARSEKHFVLIGDRALPFQIVGWREDNIFHEIVISMYYIYEQYILWCMIDISDPPTQQTNVRTTNRWTHWTEDLICKNKSTVRRYTYTVTVPCTQTTFMRRNTLSWN